MRTLFSASFFQLILFAALASGTLVAGTTLNCLSKNLLLVERVGDGGVALPGRSGVLFYQKKLVERHAGEAGDLEVKWQDISVKKELKETLYSEKNGEKTVIVTRQKISVATTDDEPLVPEGPMQVTEEALCSEVSVFRAIPSPAF